MKFGRDRIELNNRYISPSLFSVYICLFVERLCLFCCVVTCAAVVLVYSIFEHKNYVLITLAAKRPHRLKRQRPVLSLVGEPFCERTAMRMGQTSNIIFASEHARESGKKAVDQIKQIRREREREREEKRVSRVRQSHNTRPPKETEKERKRGFINTLKECSHRKRQSRDRDRKRTQKRGWFEFCLIVCLYPYFDRSVATASGEHFHWIFDRSEIGDLFVMCSHGRYRSISFRHIMMFEV